MAGTESRIRALVNEHLALGHEPSLDRSFSDSGISSMNAVAFIRIVEREFGIQIPPEDCPQIGTLGKLVSYIDSASG